VFWIGEGLRFAWPGEDLSLLGLVAGFLTVALITSALIRREEAAHALDLMGNE